MECPEILLFNVYISFLMNQGNLSHNESQIADPLIKKLDLESQRSKTSSLTVKSLNNALIQLLSAICTFLFISFIFFFALFNFFYHHYIKRDASYVEPKGKAYSDPNPSCTDDLRYYTKLIGLELATFRITTDDGFIITLHRLYDPKISIQELDKRKPILLVHGLMQSSASFLTSGYKSLAYLLVMNGFDVWLGNNRCGFEPEHVLYKESNDEMWDWDLNEMARYDIPAMVNSLRTKKRYSGKVSILSHSQGTTQCVWLFSKQFESEFHDIIDKCVLMAPAVYGGPLLNSKPFIKFMRLMPDPLYYAFFGRRAFMPILMTLRKLTYKMKSFGFTAYIVFSYLFDWNDYLWDKRIRRIHFTFAPVYVSVKLISWWLRSKNGLGFEMGEPIIKDKSSWFDEHTPDLMLVVGGRDDLVDGDMFINRLNNSEPEMNGRWDYIKIPEYSHLDVLWADDLLDRVGDRIIEFLKV